jgi:hypothetical protein
MTLAFAYRVQTKLPCSLVSMALVLVLCVGWKHVACL